MNGETAEPRLARADSGLSGLLIIDKPAGITSHDVVARVRRVAGTKRIGHTGTLDPMATGVLVLCLGQATRLIPYLDEAGGSATKEYEAQVRFGFETTTDDMEGEVRGKIVSAEDLRSDTVTAALPALRGEIQQVPPAFSAKKVAGERAYALARRGEVVELKPSTVYVYSAELAGLSGDIATLRFSCSRGTYVRSLARDLGRLVGLGAHLTGLRRTRSGHAVIASAQRLDDLTPASLRASLMPMAAILGDWPAVPVTPAQAGDIRLGRTVTVRPPAGEGAGRVRVCDSEGALVALAALDGLRLRPFCVFPHGGVPNPVVKSEVPNEDKSSSQNNKAGSEEQKET